MPSTISRSQLDGLFRKDSVSDMQEFSVALNGRESILATDINGFRIFAQPREGYTWSTIGFDDSVILRGRIN